MKDNQTESLDFNTLTDSLGVVGNALSNDSEKSLNVSFTRIEPFLKTLVTSTDRLTDQIERLNDVQSSIVSNEERKSVEDLSELRAKSRPDAHLFLVQPINGLSKSINDLTELLKDLDVTSVGAGSSGGSGIGAGGAALAAAAGAAAGAMITGESTPTAETVEQKQDPENYETKSTAKEESLSATETTKKAFNSIGDSTSEAVDTTGNVTKSIGDFTSKAVDAGGTGTKEIGNFTSKAVDYVGDGLKKLGQAVGGDIGNKLTKGGDEVKLGAVKIKSDFDKGGDELKAGAKVIKSAFDKGGDELKVGAAKIKSDFDKVTQSSPQPASQPQTNITQPKPPAAPVPQPQTNITQSKPPPKPVTQPINTQVQNLTPAKKTEVSPSIAPVPIESKMESLPKIEPVSRLASVENTINQELSNKANVSNLEGVQKTIDDQMSLARMIPEANMERIANGVLAKTQMIESIESSTEIASPIFMNDQSNLMTPNLTQTTLQSGSVTSSDEVPQPNYFNGGELELELYP